MKCSAQDSTHPGNGVRKGYPSCLQGDLEATALRSLWFLSHYTEKDFFFFPQICSSLMAMKQILEELSLVTKFYELL